MGVLETLLPAISTEGVFPWLLELHNSGKHSVVPFHLLFSGRIFFLYWRTREEGVEKVEKRVATVYVCFRVGDDGNVEGR